MPEPETVDQQKLEKLKRGIEDIVFDEIMPLVNARQTITGFVEAIKTRPTEADDLIAALKYTYVSAIVLAICRQADINDQSKSLARLIHEMTWDGDTANDLASLLKDSEEIRKYRDKRIGHTDKGKFISSLTFDNANRAIDLLIVLTEKYYERLHGSSFMLKPTAEEGWRKIVSC